MKATLKPQKEWICDRCGGIVTNAPGDGYVLLCREPEGNGPYLRFSIVHKDEITSTDAFQDSWALEDVTGEDGISRLLSLLDDGPLMKSRNVSVSAEGMPAFVDLMRRLFVPHYEESRQYFGSTSYDCNGLSEYSQMGLKRIIEEGRRTEGLTA